MHRYCSTSGSILIDGNQFHGWFDKTQPHWAPVGDESRIDLWNVEISAPPMCSCSKSSRGKIFTDVPPILAEIRQAVLGFSEPLLLRLSSETESRPYLREDQTLCVFCDKCSEGSSP
ncbi:hypothetical protein NL676_037955 [Syzygium grande]|nr:hypothetical protein NL676_037955 [Syzygium grande]